MVNSKGNKKEKTIFSTIQNNPKDIISPFTFYNIFPDPRFNRNFAGVSKDKVQLPVMPLGKIKLGRKSKNRSPFADNESQMVSNLKNTEAATIYVQATRNNTILTLVNNQGETKGWVSAGCLGFQNSRKSTTHAAEAAAAKLAEKAILLGYSRMKIKIRGLLRSTKLKVVKGLSQLGIRIVQVEQKIPLPHNGCRPRAKRRT